MEPLLDNLVRTANPESVRAAASGDGRTLFGHFSVFDAWYEVNSVFEGNFMERTVAGSFERTLAERGSQIKAQYEHGRDPFVGGSVLGPFEALREDDTGGFYQIGLIDTDYNRDRIIPQAKAGLLGASFRFRVARDADGSPLETWNMNPGVSDSNPKGLPERTINRADVYELGPVVFGASPSATAALRSDTDVFITSLLSDPLFLARFTDRAGLGVVEKLLASLPTDGQGVVIPSHGSPDGHRTEATQSTGTDPAAVRALAASLRR